MSEAETIREDTANEVCRTVLDVAMAHGVTTAVCSPGSRNAPLLIAAASRRELRKHIVIDERSAAFVALGIAATSRRPVALICTSGTAMLNYAPAVAEAYYQHLPLIVISADRPQQWIDQDDSQTIRQYEALANIVKKSYDIDGSNNPDGETLWMANRLVNDAMCVAMGRPEGPVHINVRLSPPLGAKSASSAAPTRIIRMVRPEGIPDKAEMARLADSVAAARVLVVAGFMPPDNRLNEAMARMAALPNVAVMAETISNLHLPGRPWAVDVTLSTLTARDKEKLRPDIIISIGGALVSRQIKEYMRSCTQAENWAVGYSHTTADCFKNLSVRIEADRARFIRQIAALTSRRKNITEASGAGSYATLWAEARARSIESAESFIGNAPWSELKAFDIILRGLPLSANLHLSNGTSIRYAQITMREMPHACYCNRGVSGIDGSTSTAIGSSLVYKGMTVLITGDMSMAYDIGALGLRLAGNNFRLIVIDNGGGGIFRFIGSTSGLEELEEYFCVEPSTPYAGLAKAWEWRYMEAASEKELAGTLPAFFDPAAGKTILRVKCDPETGAATLKRFMRRAAEPQG